MNEFNELWRLYELLIDFKSMLRSSDETRHLDVDDWADTEGAKVLISRQYGRKIAEACGTPWLYIDRYGGEPEAIKTKLAQLGGFSRGTVEDYVRQYVAEREKRVFGKIRKACREAYTNTTPLGIVLDGGIRVNRGVVTSMDSDVIRELGHIEKLTYIIAAGKLPSKTDRYHELSYVAASQYGNMKGLSIDVSYTRFFNSISVDGSGGGWRRRNVTLEFKDSEVFKAVMDVIRTNEAYGAAREKLPTGDTSVIDALFNVPVVSQSTERRLRL